MRAANAIGLSRLCRGRECFGCDLQQPMSDAAMLGILSLRDGPRDLRLGVVDRRPNAIAIRHILVERTVNVGWLAGFLRSFMDRVSQECNSRVGRERHRIVGYPDLHLGLLDWCGFVKPVTYGASARADHGNLVHVLG